MSLGNLASALLLPPINLMGVSLVGLALSRWRRRTGMALATAGLCGLLLLSMPAVSDRLLAGLETGLPTNPPAADPPQAIVVLTADAVRDSLGLDVGSIGLERARAAAALHRRTGLPVLVTGGPVLGSDDTLGASMARVLANELATPVRWVEPRAMDTAENADFSAAILKSNGIRSVYVVTQAWHMRRALIAFERTGIRVTAFPVRLDTLPIGTLDELIPRPSAWMTSYFALHEWIGCAYYRLMR